jgi:WD40 repeat protein
MAAAVVLRAGPAVRLPLALLAVAALAAAGAAALLPAREAAPPTVPPPPAAAAADAPAEPKPRVDRFGDPLPDGAAGRLGTVRLRHDFMIHSVHFAPDGKSVLAVAGASTARAASRWDVATGRELPAPKLSNHSIGVAYSPDGRTLLCTADKGLNLRDVATGAEVRRFDGPRSLLAVAFSPDGKLVASGGHEKSVHVWEAATGRETMSVQNLPHSVWSVVFAPRGEPALAAAVLDGTVRCFDPATGLEKWKQQAHPKSALQLAYAPDGRTLASVAEDGDAACLMDAATGKVLRRLRPEGERAGPESICFSPDGKLLATGGRDGLVRLWDPDSGKEVRHWRVSSYRVNSVAFSPDGRTLASCGGMNSAVGLSDVATGKPLFPPDGHFGLVNDLWFSADRKSLTSIGRDRRMLVWDMATQRNAERPLAAPGGGLLTTARTPDGRILATAEWLGGPVRVQDAATGKELASLGRDGTGMWALRFSPDGRLLTSGGKDRVITLWDVGRRKKVRQLEGHKEAIAQLAFSPDGHTLASTTWPEGPRLERGVQLWDVATGTKLRRLDDPSEFPNVVFSPDGKLLAVAESYHERGVRVYEVATGKERFRGVPVLRAAGLAFSPDSRLLAASGADGDDRIVLWETATWREVRQFRGHYGGALCLAFSADHRTLASGGADSTILLWDLTGGSDDGWPKPPPPQESWGDLRGDAATANRAVWALAGDPRRSVPLLVEKLRPAPAPDPAEVRRLVADLDAAEFRTRSRAEAALVKLGEPAAPALRELLKGELSPEARRAVGRLLASWEAAPEGLRAARAVQALEYAATPDARRALAELAAGRGGLRVTDEARAALRRLDCSGRL